MEPAGIIIIAVFVVMIIGISTEHANDTAAALLAFAIAASVVYLVDNIPFVVVANAMAWDVIIFLAAMMIIVSVVGSSGLFQWFALIIVKKTEGNPRKIFIYFMVLVFFISLFFSPMAIMLIVSPFTVEVCNALRIDFRPYLMTEAVVAGVGSFSTPIGSVPNLVIVYFAELDVLLLFVTMFPLSMLLFIITIFYMLKKSAKTIDTVRERDVDLLIGIEPTKMIKTKRAFYASCIGMAALVSGIIIVPREAPLVALMIAGALLLTSKDKAPDLLRHLSWDSVFFLIGIIGIIQTMIITGVIDLLSLALMGVAEANLFLAIAVMIWIPGGLLSPLDKKAVGILVAPAAAQLVPVNPMLPIALVAGTNIGGYCVPFGDSPNITVVAIAEEKGRPLTWSEFNRAIMPLGFIHLVVTTVYCALLSLVFI